jgi:multiple sugar transport system substrate-binding protein
MMCAHRLSKDTADAAPCGARWTVASGSSHLRPMDRINRRAFAATLAGASAPAVVPALAGCGVAGREDGGAVSSQRGQPATIEWYKFLNPAQAQQAPQFLAEFHAAHPAITVKLTIRPGGAAEYMEKLVAMVMAGQPPDVLQIHGAAYLAARLGIAQDLSDLYRRDKIDTAKFNRLLFQYGSQWEGKTYGLPFANMAEALALIYNRNHLQAAGVAEPPDKWNEPSWTWERFVEAAKKLVKTGPDGKTAVHGLNRLGSFVLAPQAMWGATWIKDDYTTVVCDAQEMIDAYQALADLNVKHRVWPQAGETADFRQQTTAFSVLGPWELLEYAKLPPEVDWAFAPFPKGTPGTKASPQGYIFDHKLAKGSANREPAWTFMRWLTEKSRLAFFEGRTPVFKEDVPRWTAEIFKDRPNVRASVATDAYDHAARPELIFFHPKWASDMNALVTGEFWNPVFAGEKPVGPALRELKPRLQQLAGA